jgi:Abnormal spindle-like microcephaly-assoc'd, ASPM-SPD-2-Hydin
MTGALKSMEAKSTAIPRILMTRAATVARLFCAIVAFLALFSTSGCVGYAGSPNAAKPKGSLVVTPNAIHFGSVGVGSSANQAAIVSNHGTENMTITNISAKGSEFRISGFSGRTILAPGHTIKLTVFFTPKSAGELTGDISITTASKPAEAMATLSGTGANSKLTMTPSAVNFGNVSVGSPTTQTMKLTDEGTGSVLIISTSVSGAGFSISGLSTPQTLTPKQSLSFTVKFDPKTAGSATGQVSVVASGGAETIDLSGIGVSSKVGLSASATSITFGNVKVGSPATQTITLKSTGNSSVDISNVSISGSGYTFSGVAPNTMLDPGQSAVLSVSFDPKTAGSSPGMVTISSDAPNPKMNITLSGAGTSSQQPSVELKWQQSTSSQVVGYFVYRGTKLGGTYSKLNSEPDSGLSYTDNTVASGQSYVYVVTSVGSDGVQSSYSTPIDVSIPAN